MILKKALTRPVREIGYLTDTEYVYGYETRVEAALAMKYITSQVEG